MVERPSLLLMIKGDVNLFMYGYRLLLAFSC
jgi:hypothetical protein